MAVLSNDGIRAGAVASASGGDESHKIERSCRFNVNEYATRLSQIGDSRTFTLAGWVKRGSLLAAGATIISAGYDGSNWHQLALNASGQFQPNHQAGAGGGPSTEASKRLSLIHI